MSTTIIKSILCSFLMGTSCTILAIGSGSEDEQDNPFLRTGGLSVEDKERFIQQVRLVLHDLGFAHFASYPIIIDNGSYAESCVAFLKVGSDYYQKLPTRWLKAALGHELIHMEKYNACQAAATLLAYATLSYKTHILSSAIILVPAIKLGVSRSIQSGVMMSLAGLSLLGLCNELAIWYLHNREKEADIESASRWGTAQDLMELFQYKFNRYYNTQLTIDEIRQQVNTVEPLTQTHPTMKDRLNYLYPIAQQQKKNES
jgi:Peptidase family M48